MIIPHLFLCVLFGMPEIILAGVSLDGQQASAELYKLAEPCLTGECDAFFSHSWHDDALQKWEALVAWCEEFKSDNKRSPRLWLDKVCIDQTNIKEDLQCLPHAARCERLDFYFPLMVLRGALRIRYHA